LFPVANFLKFVVTEVVLFSVMRLAAKHGNVTDVYSVINCAESQTTHSIRQNESIRIGFSHY